MHWLLLFFYTINNTIAISHHPEVSVRMPAPPPISSPAGPCVAPGATRWTSEPRSWSASRRSWTAPSAPSTRPMRTGRVAMDAMDAMGETENGWINGLVCWGKFTGLRPILNGKIGKFPVDFPLNQSNGWKMDEHLVIRTGTTGILKKVLKYENTSWYPYDIILLWWTMVEICCSYGKANLEN